MKSYQNQLIDTLKVLSNTGSIKLLENPKTFTLKINNKKTKHKFEILPIIEEQGLIQKLKGNILIDVTINSLIDSYQESIEFITPEEKYLTTQLFTALIETKKYRQEETTILETKWESLKLQDWFKTDVSQKRKSKIYENIILITNVLLFVFFIIINITFTVKERQIELLKEQIEILERP